MKDKKTLTLTDSRVLKLMDTFRDSDGRLPEFLADKEDWSFEELGNWIESEEFREEVESEMIRFSDSA